MSHDIQKVFFAFSKVFKLLSMWQSFKSINSSALSRKKYDGDNFSPIFRQQLQSQNKSVGIGLVEFSWAFCYIELQTIFWKLHFANYFTFLHVFLWFIFVWNKIFCSKNWIVFYIFYFVWANIQCWIIKDSVYL